MDPKTNLITTLKGLEDSIEKGDLDKLKENINRFHQDLERNKKELKLCSSGSQCATQTALILAACRSNQADILYYLLYETDFSYFPCDCGFDDKDVQTQRTEAFKFAINWDAFPMVDMLYDYWSGDLHWIGHDINKLRTLGETLEKARDAECVVENQPMLIDIHSLIKFNAFQQKLYSSITNIPKEKTADGLVEVFRIYEEYSDIHKVRRPHEIEDIERQQRNDLDDKISEYMRMHVYTKYIVYFRKLDFNIALLILDNWFILRGQFKDRFNQPKEYFEKNPEVKSSYEKAVSLYKDIECTFYHFIYRTWDDWRLYLPRNRQITVEDHHTGIHKGKIIENIKIKYDKHTLENGPVLFLERKSFSDRVKELKTLLEEHIISVNLTENLEQNYKMKETRHTILLDENYLTPLTPTDTNTPSNTNMRDFYSLSKIVYYIKAIENTNDNDIDVLMIERVLQVTGEMSKSWKERKNIERNESNNLSDSAKSLLQIAISVDTVRHFSKIRRFLSHAEKGELSTRADIAESNKSLFYDIRQDLIIIKQMITSVRDIYKKILDKSLLEKGLTLLDKRIENLPDEALRHIDEISHCYKIHGLDLLDAEKSKPLIRRLSEDTGLSTNLLKEIVWIFFNTDSIKEKKELAKKDIGKKIVSILPIYIQNINQVLVAEKKNNENVKFIKQELKECNIKEIILDNSIKDLTDEKCKIIRRITKKKKQPKKANVDYDTILLTLNDIQDFSGHWDAIEKMLSFCYDECDLLGPKPEIQKEVPLVTTILKELESKCISVKNVAQNHTFNAIRKLYDIFENHDGSGIGQDQLKSCIISRVNLLKDILQYSQHKSPKVNLCKYKKDQKFRFQLEMVLSDIANLFKACKIKGKMNKSNMLLRDIDLRNVLNHGNPFLDVLADVFDPYDLSTGLLTIAKMFAEQGESMIQN